MWRRWHPGTTAVRHVAPPVSIRSAAAVAVLSGIVGVTAFPRFDVWPAAVVGVAGLSFAVHGRRARTGAWLGLLHGLAFFLPLLSWTGIYVGPAPWLLLAVSQAAFVALLGAVLVLVQRLPAAPFGIAGAWILQEALRGRLPFGGFPWGRLAFSQQDSPLRWFAVLAGMPGLSFAVALSGGALATAGLAVATRRRPVRRVRAAAAAALAAAAVPVVGALWGAVWAAPGPLGPDAGVARGHLAIAVVQGSVPDRGLAFQDRARQVLDNHVSRTLRLAAEVRAGRRPQPDLVIWPENASDVDPLVDRAAAAAISRAVRAVRAPVLVGAILNGPGPDHRRNAGILWSATTGPGARYVKRHPVPFAEYIPLRALAERVSSAAKLVTQDMVAGTGDGLLRGGPVPIGDVICFEVAYDDLVHSSVSAGAQLVVVQTNNATFGHTAETWQQLAMSRLRAIETDRTVIQSSTTGISAVIAPDGGIAARADALFRPAVLSSEITVQTTVTPAVRLGATPEWTVAVLTVAAAGWAVLAPRVRRRARPGVADDLLVRVP